MSTPAVPDVESTSPDPSAPRASPDHSAPSVWSILVRPQRFEQGEDRLAAPMARDRACEARWASWRFGAAHGARGLMAGWIFLLFFLVPVVASADNAVQVVLAIGYVVLVGLLYVGAAWLVEARLAVRAGYLVAFGVALFGGSAWIAGSFAVAMLPYFTIMAAHLLPWRHARPLILVSGVIGAVVGGITTNWYALLLAVVAVGFGWVMGAGLESARLGERLQRRLQRSEARVATLAVAAERERIGRDLHDILGHSLTAVAVKAGLASRLVTVDPDATREQLLEIEQVARQALADVRATASAYRQVRLAGEIAGARSILQAGGVSCAAPASLDPMPDDVSEFFGFVVREGVTNVIRHADATAVIIAVTTETRRGSQVHRVTVADDGVGPAGGHSDPIAGSGVVGLAERAARLSGHVTLEPRTPRGTVLAATVPVRDRGTP